MTHFIIGMMVGSVLTATLVAADNVYDAAGNPAAPRGSIQQYDYFRERALQLDVGAIRRNLLTPCPR